jgi:hypothetical protein
MRTHESAGEGHEDNAGICEAAGSHFCVPVLRNVPRNLKAERQGHCDYFYKRRAGLNASCKVREIWMLYRGDNKKLKSYHLV